MNDLDRQFFEWMREVERDRMRLRVASLAIAGLLLAVLVLA